MQMRRGLQHVKWAISLPFNGMTDYRHTIFIMRKILTMVSNLALELRWIK